MAVNRSQYRGSIDSIGRYTFSDGENVVAIRDGYISVSDGYENLPSIQFSSDNRTGIYSPSPEHIGFVTGGHERASFNPDGYFSINTADAVEYLTIDGVMAVSEQVEPPPDPLYGKIYMKDNGLLYFKNNTGFEFSLTAGDLSGSGPVGGSGGAGRVAFWVGTTTLTGVTDLYWNNATTSLGIGTGTPQKTLDVNGEVTTTDHISVVKSGVSTISIKNTSVADNPQYLFGNIDSDSINISFTDDSTSEQNILSLNKDGITQSIRSATGSHFEGFIVGDTYPLVRISSDKIEFRDIGDDSVLDTAFRRTGKGILRVEDTLHDTGTIEAKVLASSDGYLIVGSQSTAGTNHGLGYGSTLITGDLEVDGYLWADNGLGVQGNFGFSGTLEADGYIIPRQDNEFGVGRADRRWHSVFVGPGSFHIKSLVSETETGVERDWAIGASGFGDLRIVQGSDELFTITSDGSVGIGTNDPQGLLQVAGSVVVNDNVRIGDYPTGDSVLIKRDGTSVFFRNSSDASYINIQSLKLLVENGSISSPSISFINNSGTGISRPSNNTMVFSTASSESFRVHPAGGISVNSTTQPVSPSKFYVGGSAGISVDGISIFGSGVANETITIGGRLSLVETTTPTATSSYGKLYVSSSDNDLHFMDSSGVDINMSAAGSGVTLIDGASGRVAFFASSSSLQGSATGLYWDNSNGFFGVKTTTPKNALDVEGSVAIGAGYSGTETAPSNSLIVQGSVGVGNTSPNEKVTVSGAVSLAEISAPSATSGFGKIYVKTDEDLYYKDSSGSEINLSTFGGDIDGGTFDDTYVNTSNIDGGTF